MVGVRRDADAVLDLNGWGHYWIGFRHFWVFTLQCSRRVGVDLAQWLTDVEPLFLGGTYLSTLANGVLAFGLFGVAFVGGWVEYVGWFTKNQVAVNIGIISSLIIPSEALWKRAAHLMESPLIAATGFSPFTAASPPSPTMVWYAVGYAVVILALAVRQFSRRDL